MFWNWFTLDACFFSTKWRITSHGVFVAFCLGVIALVIVLELLRRLHREYDRYITSKSMYQPIDTAQTTNEPNTTNTSASDGETREANSSGVNNEMRRSDGPLFDGPSAKQQCIRAAIHTLQFAVTYVIMLLAMYYNGYILICILVGAFIGYFLFNGDGIKVSSAYITSLNIRHFPSTLSHILAHDKIQGLS